MKLLFVRIFALVTILAAIVASSSHGAVMGLGVLGVGSFATSLLHKMPVPAGALFAYTGSAIADIFIPEVYGSIQANDSTETSAFAQSGVAVTNPLLQEKAQTGTRLIEIPFWNDLDASGEPNYGDDSDDVATVDKVDTDSLNARNAYLNKVYGAADLAVEMAKATPGDSSGPMTRIRNRFGNFWMIQFQKRIVAIARGLHLSNVANNSGDMTHDISLQTTVGVGDANYISADAVVEATFTLGDRYKNIRAIAMHSFVYKRLVKQQLIEQVRDAEGTLMYESYMGLRVVVDDDLPVVAGTTSGLRYMSILFGPGAIGYGEGTPNKPFEVGREALQGKGAGNEYIVERKTWLIHPHGFDWTNNTVTGATPTLANLRLAANWTRLLPRKHIPMAFLWTNG